jgi:hypothetical protein
MKFVQRFSSSISVKIIPQFQFLPAGVQLQPLDPKSGLENLARCRHIGTNLVTAGARLLLLSASSGLMDYGAIMTLSFAKVGGRLPSTGFVIGITLVAQNAEAFPRPQPAPFRRVKKVGGS